MTGLDNNQGVDPDELEKAEDMICSKGQSLQALENGTEVLFSELVYRSRIFKFASTTAGSKCIITNPINDTWIYNGANVWFTLTPNSEDNCLENNSLWEVESSSTHGFGQYYRLRRIKNPSERLVEMNAHQSVRGTYAHNRVGLQVMVCKNNQ